MVVTVINHKMAAYNGTTSEPSSINDLDELEFDTALSRLEQTQNRILNSTTRSLGLIEESHDIAIKTAEELQRQEESLLRTDRNLDDMRKNMASANRHIKSVKSVWGAIGNYFSKPATEKSREDVSQPVKASIPEKSLNIDTNLELNYGQQDYLSDYGRGRGTAAFERQHDTHLDEISRGLSILKDDALVLGNTLDRHDEIISRVQGKMDVVHGEVEDADRKVRKILRR